MSMSTLYRRAMMMLGIGRVSLTNDGGSVQKVQYSTPLEVRGDTPRMMEFGFSSSLPADSDVLIAYLGGDRSNAVVIASGHKASRKTDLAQGESILYNMWGLHLKLTKTGIEIDAKGQAVNVINATKVTIVASEEVFADTPVLRCSGDIIDNAGSNTTTLKNLRDVYNGHNHVVKNVQSGSSSPTSEKPGETVQ
ncbi:baseplate assembly protein [Ewingella americana]|uniref:phage baseplate assembly protein domain-containing protein n=1 Tax=Rahnella victoriana TaxID=1510570 RepID=UPI000BB16E78|nr:phage baseplate assembly protein [Rahnella victoriana]PBI78637.1 baseplate assembly protein [Rahnella victoriana]PKB90813.1 baseplate assembly protein [Ewingella americana]